MISVVRIIPFLSQLILFGVDSMFKLQSILIVLICIIVFSCKDSDSSVDITLEKSQLLGKWEQTGGTDLSGDVFKACTTDGGTGRIIEFTDTEFIESGLDDDGCATSTSLTLTYTLDGNKIVVGGGLNTYTVTSISDIEIKTDLSSNVSTSTGNIALKKVN